MRPAASRVDLGKLMKLRLRMEASRISWSLLKGERVTERERERKHKNTNSRQNQRKEAPVKARVWVCEVVVGVSAGVRAWVCGSLYGCVYI